MKLNTLREKSFCIARIGLALTVFMGSVWAQEQSATPEQKPLPARYSVTDLGTLPDGTFSQATDVNRNGLVSGLATLPDGTQHAVLWQRGLIMDIGAPGLGGPNSGAFGVNGRSQVVGQAETSSLDPNGEDFCGYGTHLICLPFLWQYGVMLPLPTLEGNNGGTNRINNRGEVVGYAENATPDQTCPGAVPQVLQERPVIWKNGEIHELPTFPGDPDGFAFGINDNGQAVGASGICATLNPDTLVYVLARHALLWDQGTVTDLGNLGGTGSFGPGNFAHDVNSQGQVVGASDLPGDATFHGFLWTRETGIQDIGTLPGDFASAALGISDGGEVAGVSLDANFNLRAFLRQNGVMTDLNTLVPADSPLFLLLADVINPRGEIEGFAFDTETAEVHGFLATPTNSVAATEGSSPAALGGTSKAAKVVLTENARKLLQQRLRFRLPGAQLTAPQ